MKEHYKTERELVELIGRSYAESNIELIKPYLHTNIIYASAWVKEPLYGVKKLLNYLDGKFKTQSRSGWKTDYVIHPLRYNKYHFLVLKQNNDREKPQSCKLSLNITEFITSVCVRLNQYPSLL